MKRGGGVPKRENGKRAYGAMRSHFFRPTMDRVRRDTITKLWRKLVMDAPPTGLGIEKHLYAPKHTRTDDKVEAGLEL